MGCAMTESLRPCPSCGRHARTDERRCPFCDAELPLLHRLPVVPMPLREERLAPKYGGPPLRRPSTWLAALIFLSAAAVAAWWWWLRR